VGGGVGVSVAVAVAVGEGGGVKVGSAVGSGVAPRLQAPSPVIMMSSAMSSDGFFIESVSRVGQMPVTL
jgi:hypothetical protein